MKPAEILETKMLYEPPKTKRYILIGASAVVLAVLVVVIFSVVGKNKKSQTPADSTAVQEKMKQENIQKQGQRLDEIRESAGIKDYTPEEINQQSQKLDELRKQIEK